MLSCPKSVIGQKNFFSILARNIIIFSMFYDSFFNILIKVHFKNIN